MTKTTPKYLVIAKHEHKHGTDALPALTSKGHLDELPKLTPKVAYELFGVIFDPAESDGQGGHETLEWSHIVPLNRLHIV